MISIVKVIDGADRDRWNVGDNNLPRPWSPGANILEFLDRQCPWRRDDCSAAESTIVDG